MESSCSSIISQGKFSKTHSEGNSNTKQGATPLEDWAFVFGQTVADSFFQCDTKDWPRLKKKYNMSTYSNDSYKNLFLLLLKLGIEIKQISFLIDCTFCLTINTIYFC